MRTILAVALTLICSVGHAAEWTAKHPILRVLYDGATGTTTAYFETATGTWSPAGCPNARYVMVRGVEGSREILAIALSAKLGDKLVQFYGTCYDATYFSAHYITVE